MCDQRSGKVEIWTLSFIQSVIMPHTSCSAILRFYNCQYILHYTALLYLRAHHLSKSVLCLPPCPSQFIIQICSFMCSSSVLTKTTFSLILGSLQCHPTEMLILSVQYSEIAYNWTPRRQLGFCGVRPTVLSVIVQRKMPLQAHVDKL